MTRAVIVGEYLGAIARHPHLVTLLGPLPEQLQPPAAFSTLFHQVGSTLLAALPRVGSLVIKTSGRGNRCFMPGMSFSLAGTCSRGLQDFGSGYCISTSLAGFTSVTVGSKASPGTTGVDRF